MKKILSERSLVVILFLAALTVFSLAQEDAKKIEKMSQPSEVSNLIPAMEPTADNTITAKKQKSLFRR